MMIEPNNSVQLQIPRYNVKMGCGSTKICGVMELTTVMTTVMRETVVSPIFHLNISTYVLLAPV